MLLLPPLLPPPQRSTLHVPLPELASATVGLRAEAAPLLAFRCMRAVSWALRGRLNDTCVCLPSHFPTTLQDVQRTDQGMLCDCRSLCAGVRAVAAAPGLQLHWMAHTQPIGASGASVH